MDRVKDELLKLGSQHEIQVKFHKTILEIQSLRVVGARGCRLHRGQERVFNLSSINACRESYRNIVW